MAHLWSPDTCLPAGQPCVLEIVDGHRALVSVVRLCAHHFTIRAGLASNDALFDAMLVTNRAKNFGTYEVAKELAGARALDAAGGANELHGTIPWRMDDQDRVIVTSGLSGQRRTRTQTAVDARVGAGKVIVE